MYTIELADGTTITGLTSNGNHYVSRDALSRKVFSRNLSHVKVTSDNLPPMEGDDWKPDVKYDDYGMTGEFENLTLSKFEELKAGGVWFVLRERSAMEQEVERLKAEVDYLTMLTEGL